MNTATKTIETATDLFTQFKCSFTVDKLVGQLLKQGGIPLYKKFDTLAQQAGLYLVGNGILLYRYLKNAYQSDQQVKLLTPQYDDTRRFVMLEQVQASSNVNMPLTKLVYTLNNYPSPDYEALNFGTKSEREKVFNILKKM